MPLVRLDSPVEHFVTLFDSNFLPMGMCLHRSLLDHGRPFRLWIVCLDEAVEQGLRRLSLPHVSLIPLREAEDERLLAVKPARTRGEYCWTLTPFTPQFVFERDPGVERVTYLDADMFFFASPQTFFREFEISEKHVMITEHAYDPRYDRTRRSGRFCVQFVTFRRTPASEKVMRWWQDRCLEWCFAKVEDGKFGDQKYLDAWPALFADEVHILKQMDRTLAPWNVHYYGKQGGGRISPVFYHFHGLRLISPELLLLYSGYEVGHVADALYETYRDTMGECVAQMEAIGIPVHHMPLSRDLFSRLLRWKRRILGGEGCAPFPPPRHGSGPQAVDDR
jgi:hypothetical protein